MKKIVTKPATAGLKVVQNKSALRTDRRVEDLNWRIKFTQMKLNHWSGTETNGWYDLVRMQERAKRELIAIAS